MADTSALVVVPVVILASGVGVALLRRRQGDRRLAGAAEVAADRLARYPLRLSAERYPYGRSFQFRLLPSTRREWAPGILGVTSGEIGFVPSDPAKHHLAWIGRPAAVELSSLAQATIVRVRTDDPAQRAQFVVQQPRTSVRTALASMVPVASADDPRAGGA